MELNDNFILSGEEIDSLNLFDSSEESEVETPKQDTKEVIEEKPPEDTSTTEEKIDEDNLFSSESVGSENNEEEITEKKGKGVPDSNEDIGPSPNSNFYYSIANALVEDGILPDLDNDFIKDIKSPEDFAAAIDKQIEAKLDETQKRINEALNANVAPDEIRQYETVLDNLNKITEDSINDESERGENLRKQLIFQDLINRGFSKERATREVKKSIDSGSDIDDAKEALESNINFFNQQYENLIKESKEAVDAEKQRQKKEAADLKKQMLEDKEIFEGVTIDKATRQKAYDSIVKPAYKTENGDYITALQKYEMDNPVEFRKKLGVIFTLTDGFKNLDALVKGKVRKEVRKNIRELEHTLKNTNIPKGNPTYISNVDDDESYAGKGWNIDI